MPLTEKRVAVYMLSVLVANNSKVYHKTKSNETIPVLILWFCRVGGGDRLANHKRFVYVCFLFQDLDRLLLRPPGVSKPCSICSGTHIKFSLFRYALLSAFIFLL